MQHDGEENAGGRQGTGHMNGHSARDTTKHNRTLQSKCARDDNALLCHDVGLGRSVGLINYAWRILKYANTQLLCISISEGEEGAGITPDAARYSVAQPKRQSGFLGKPRF